MNIKHVISQYAIVNLRVVPSILASIIKSQAVYNLPNVILPDKKQFSVTSLTYIAKKLIAAYLGLNTTPNKPNFTFLAPFWSKLVYFFMLYIHSQMRCRWQNY